MPRSRKKRYGFKKRRTRRRSRRRRQPARNRCVTRVIRNPSLIMPDRLRTKLKWTNDQTISAILSTYSTITFSGNSAFDPSQAWGGTQPMGYDQLVALYARYTVVASTIKCYCTDTSGVQNQIKLSIFPDIDSTPPSSYRGMSEQAYSTSKQMSEQQDAVRIKNFMTTKKIYGVSNVHHHGFGAQAAFDPNLQWFWHLGAEGSLSVQMTVNVHTEITYYVEFNQRQSIGTS